MAAQGHVDPAADLAPIRALLDQGCDLEADVVPIVARGLPEFPRPLKNWGAPWLVRAATARLRISAPSLAEITRFSTSVLKREVAKLSLHLDQPRPAHGPVLRFGGKNWPLQVLPVRVPVRPRPVAIMRLKNRTLSPVAQAFINCAKSVASGMRTK